MLTGAMGRGTARWAVGALCAVMALAACRAPPTQLVLRITTDMQQGPGRALTGLHVMVRSGGADVDGGDGGRGIGLFDRVADLGTSGPDAVTLPTNWLVIAAADADPRREVTVIIDALHDGTPLFRVTHSARFVPGRTTLFEVALAGRCCTGDNRMCPDGFACGPAGCEPEVQTAPRGAWYGGPPGTACPPDQTLCDTDCVDTRSDPLHCGGCGTRCTAACEQGHCLEVASIASGGAHSCAVMADTTVRCWGSGRSFQLGVGPDRTVHAAPTAVTLGDGSLLRGVAALALGSGHSCARMQDGSVMCWGDDEEGQLGTDSMAMRTPWIPAPVVGVPPVVEVVAGRVHTCARTDAGEVYCWGFAGEGKLGFPDAGNVSSARRVALPDGARAYSIAAGDRSTYAAVTLADGTHAVFAWGADYAHQLGAMTDGAAEQPLPVRVALTVPVARVASAALSASACALTDATPAQVICWGMSEAGQTGSGRYSKPVLPSNPVVQATGATQLTLGRRHGCALVGSQAVCWGSNDCCEVSDNCQEACANGALPTAPTAAAQCGTNPLGDDVAQLASGGDHTCALRRDGVVLCWGRDDSGELGDGQLVNRADPHPVVWRAPGP